MTRTVLRREKKILVTAREGSRAPSTFLKGSTWVLMQRGSCTGSIACRSWHGLTTHDQEVGLAKSCLGNEQASLFQQRTVQSTRRTFHQVPEVTFLRRGKKKIIQHMTNTLHRNRLVLVKSSKKKEVLVKSSLTAMPSFSTRAGTGMTLTHWCNAQSVPFIALLA